MQIFGWTDLMVIGDEASNCRCRYVSACVRFASVARAVIAKSVSILNSKNKLTVFKEEMRP